MSPAEVHFIVSAPRSGSTWLAAALNGHPEIFATEQRLFGEFCQMWPNNDGQLRTRITFDAYARAVSVHYFHEQFAKSREDFVEDITAAYAEFLVAYGLGRSGKRMLVDKITPYAGTASHVIERIHRHFPMAKIIQLVRDGRDVVTSGTFDWILKDAHRTARHEVFVEHNPGVRLTRFFDDAVMTKWADIWRETIDLFARIKPNLTIRYEDMLGNQPGILNDIFAELNVEAGDEIAAACADNVTFEKMTGRVPGDESPTAKHRSGTRGSWKKYFTRQDGELFHSIAGGQLIAAGYETHDSWWKELPSKLAPDRIPLPDGASRS